MRKIFQQKTLFFLFILFYIIVFSSKDNYKYTIESDGAGYYSYLPAMYLLNDKTFEKSNDAKFLHTQKRNDFVLKTEDGRSVNKYFGGVSFVATPAFFIITGITKLMGDTPDGYNLQYFVGMFVFSIFLLIFGYLLYRNIAISEYGLTKGQQLIFIPIFITAPWIIAAFYQVMYANNYLFCILVICLYLILKIRNEPTNKWNIYLFFFVVGTIAIIRPTSLIFLLILPYFFNSWKDFSNFMITNVLQIKTIAIGLIFFSIPVIYQFIVWKWQTGSFFLWSYGGEGFNWLKPQLLEQFFSYRTGILFHSPILLIALIYVLFQIKKNTFKSIVYMIFFFSVCYVSSAWWCYDFETRYGLRNFNEFYVFLFLPLFDLVKDKKAIKITLILLIICTVLSFIRLNQYFFEHNTNQRFTASSYWKSLVFWKPENKDRWLYYRSLPPFGKRISHEVLIQADTCKINSEDEFYLTKRLPLTLKPGERSYLIIKGKREFIGENNLHVPLLVVDYTSSTGNELTRHYSAASLYSDKLAEKEDVLILRYLFDNKAERDEVAIYIWNQGKVNGMFTDFTVEFERYDAMK